MKSSMIKKIFLVAGILTFLVMIGGYHLVFATPPTSEPTNSSGLNEQSLNQGGLLYSVAYFFGKLVWFAGQLMNWAMNLNNQIVVNNPAVDAGWIITRDVANLGFVLAIIYIAFATILDQKAYGTRQLLSKLIIAALLVNFSKVIAGIFLDFSGLLSTYFISYAKDPGRIADAITAALSPQQLLQIPQPNSFVEVMKGGVGILGGISGTVLELITGLIFVVLFTSITAITLLFLAAMFLIRYLVLSILVILMPIAWLFSIFPELSSHWKKWWGTFLQWIFFAPAATFFIMLAVRLGAETNNPLVQFNAMSDAVPAFFNFQGNNITKMILVIGLLIGGMMAAHFTGLAATDGAFKLASSAKDFMIDQTVGKGMRRRVSERVKTLGYKKPDEEGKGGGSFIQRTSARFAGTPLLGGAARAINKWATVSGKEQVETYEKELEKLANDKQAFLNAGKNSYNMSNPTYAAAYGNVAANKGILKDLEKELPEKPEERMGDTPLEKGVLASRKMGTESKILSKNPMMARIGESNPTIWKEKVKKNMEKMKPKDVSELLPYAFANPEVAFYLSNGSFSELAKTGTEDQIEALEKILKEYQGKNADEWRSLSVGQQKLEEDYKRGMKNLEMWFENPAWLSKVKKLVNKTIDTNLESKESERLSDYKERKA